MAFNNKENEPKKGFSGSFFLFILAALLVMFIVQNLASEKSAKVSFSHQVEHLVNLDLIHKDQGRKTALNDNLVTFTGKFRDSLKEESKQRYRFLELINQRNELTDAKKRLAKDLSTQETIVKDAGAEFLLLSGVAIPRNGYSVIGSTYNTSDRENAIIIQAVPDKSMRSLSDLKYDFSRLNEGTAASFKDDLSALITAYRSPRLGIGSAVMKEKLDHIADQVNAASGTFEQQQAVFSSALITLTTITSELGQEKNGIRLLQLRSVRNYLVDLEQFSRVTENLIGTKTQLEKARSVVANVTWFYNNKELSTRALEKQDPEEFNRWFAGAQVEWENFGNNKGLAFKAPDQPRNLVLERTFKSREPSRNLLSYLFTILPVVLVILLLYFVFSRQMKGMGNSAMNFGKSPAKMLTKSTNKITFKDVAGVDEGKEELEEIVDFLKDPGKFTALGARIPKGVLCVGPPGTGKTLIAKAVAGEADRPFFSISGSDFVEMFVGVGASRIRDLFDQAKKNSPCIVFIDEIDAVGRHRGAGIGGGHDEREQTLNQLLVEMDGFDTNEGVILMAATNRPDVLDKALLRPGRFDRQIVLDLPDIKGRLEILKVHAKRIKLDETVDLMQIARATPGSSGADLANILNESALLAARRGRSAVTLQDALHATEKVLYGKERRSLELSEKEKRHTAYHESGHAIVGLVVDTGDPVEKVTIVPRGMSLGATHFVPEKNRLSYWKKELIDKLAVLMGGRIAEEIFVGDFSSGAQMDIAQATRLARSMVCEWGMTDRLGAVSYDERSQEGSYLMPGAADKNYSPETAKVIDDEVRRLLDEANERASEIISTHKEQVELMTNMLMEFEDLDKEDIKKILHGTWSAEEKRKKVQAMVDSHRKLPPPPPADIKTTDNPGDLNPAHP